MSCSFQKLKTALFVLHTLQKLKTVLLRVLLLSKAKTLFVLHALQKRKTVHLRVLLFSKAKNSTFRFTHAPTVKNGTFTCPASFKSERQYLSFYTRSKSEKRYSYVSCFFQKQKPALYIPSFSKKNTDIFCTRLPPTVGLSARGCRRGRPASGAAGDGRRRFAARLSFFTSGFFENGRNSSVFKEIVIFSFLPF